MLQNTDYGQRTRDADVQATETTVKIQWTRGSNVLWRQKAVGLSLQTVGIWLLFRINDHFIFRNNNHKYYNLICIYILLSTLITPKVMIYIAIFMLSSKSKCRVIYLMTLSVTKIIVSVLHEQARSTGWIMQQETEVIREKPTPLPLCPPNPTWAGLRLNLDLHGEKAASHGTDR